MNAPVLCVWRTFLDELNGLDQSVTAQTKKALRLLAHDVNHPSLDTKRRNQYGQRKMLASRINRHYRVLWERMPNNRIAIWHVVSHKESEMGKWIPTQYEPVWKQWIP